MAANLICACGFRTKTKNGLEIHRSKNWCGRGHEKVGSTSPVNSARRRTTSAQATAPKKPRKRTPKTAQISEEVRCPVCGSATNLRTAKRGKRAGHQFYGCVDWPDCDGTVDSEVVNSSNANAGPDNETGQPARPASGKLHQDTRERDDSRTPVAVSDQPRVVSSKPRTSNFQIKHFQSVSLPSKYVEAIYATEPSRMSRRGFAHWRLEFPIIGEGIRQSIAPVISVCEALLNRGSVAYCTPGLEELAQDSFSESVEDGNFLTDPAASLSSPLTIDISESEDERKFLILLREVVGKPYDSGWSIVPQVHLSSINPEIDAQSSTRCDFFLTHVSGLAAVVEIDGQDHSEHQEVDGVRDRKLAEVGVKTLRVPVDEVRSASGQSIESVFDFVRSAIINERSSHDQTTLLRLSRFAHQVQVSLLEMLRGGFLTDTGDSTIGVVGPHDLPDDLLSQWLDRSSSDLSEMLERSASLLGVQTSRLTFKPSLIDPAAAKCDIYLLPDEHSADEHLANESATRFYYSDVCFPFDVSSPVTASGTANSVQPSLEDASWFLDYVFRKQSFWEGQWAVIERSLQRKDSVVLLPTGAGKSIAFQLSALLLPGRCIVVDPIVSLIEDQLDNLMRVGIDRAVGISSRLDRVAREQALSAFSAGQYLFCYVAPERFQTAGFRESLRSLTVVSPVSLIAIDEAHMISEWGHDFRTAYLNIGRVSREYCSTGNVIPPLAALTGTASKVVLKDVQRELGIEDFEAIITPSDFNREELNFVVLSSHSDEKQHRLRGFLERLPSDFGVAREQMFQPNGENTFAGMVFCPHVNGDFGVLNQSEFLAATLGTEVAIYSGSAPKAFNHGVWDDTKNRQARRFKRNDVALIACTKAFGMGIDKPNVRYTAHIGIPQSIESFYQEAGRAGRNRKRAYCAIILSNDDPARTDRLLSPTTTIQEIAATVKDTSWSDSDDVIRSLYFHASAFSGIDVELAELAMVTKDLKISSKRARVRKVWGRDDGLNRQQFEKALHRLVVLGIVSDYAVDYARDEFDITMSGISKDDVAINLGRYIGAYQSRLGRDYENRANAIQKRSIRDHVVAVGELLITFIYDHIEQSRRASMREMLNAASRAKNDGELLRESILDYLQHAEFDADINQLLQSERGGLDSIEQLLDGIVHPRDAQSLRGATAQALGSYPDVPALHLLRGLTEALDPNAQTTVVEESIKACVQFGIGSYSLTPDEVARAVSQTVRLEVLASMWKTLIVEITTEAAGEDVEFLRSLVKTLPGDLVHIPANELINTYSARAGKIIDERKIP
jgi:ATP-dependent DNA helicase RecQ